MFIPDDNVKKVVNTKLQEELYQASAKDQERKKNKQMSQKTNKSSQFKAENLNNLDINNENDKSKMIEQLMEMSIGTKQTRGNNYQ